MLYGFLYSIEALIASNHKDFLEVNKLFFLGLSLYILWVDPYRSLHLAIHRGMQF
jgi:hypothetical protein